MFTTSTRESEDEQNLEYRGLTNWFQFKDGKIISNSLIVFFSQPFSHGSRLIYDTHTKSAWLFPITRKLAYESQKLKLYKKRKSFIKMCHLILNFIYSYINLRKPRTITEKGIKKKKERNILLLLNVAKREFTFLVPGNFSCPTTVFFFFTFSGQTMLLFCCVLLRHKN